MLPVFINQVSLEPQLIVIYTLLWLFMCYWGFPGGSVVKKKKKTCLPMQEILIQSLDWEGPLEKEMATHFSIIAWEIPWTEDPTDRQSTE